MEQPTRASIRPACQSRAGHGKQRRLCSHSRRPSDGTHPRGQESGPRAAALLPPPSTRHLEAWVPYPERAGPRGDSGPRGPHPSAPARASLPAPPSGPAFPASLNRGAARAELSPHNRWPIPGVVCSRGRTPTAAAAGAGEATPVLIPAPPFPAPRRPRLLSPASEASRRRSPDPARGFRIPCGKEPREPPFPTGSREEERSVARLRSTGSCARSGWGSCFSGFPWQCFRCRKIPANCSSPPASPSHFRDVCDSCRRE